ncbi:hypothetical protein [Sphingomonas sp. UYP23]
MTQLRSSLAAHAGSMRDPDPDAARAMAKRGWHDRGFVAIDPAWLTSWVDQEQLIILAERVHGERKPSG